MSGFSADWLALREPADMRARNGELAAALSARLGQRAHLDVVDLGSGTGSNLRGTAPLLGQSQAWTLVDYDPRLLEAARGALAGWADTSRVVGDRLELTKDGRRITVAFRQADLARDLAAGLGEGADLVTASALFDLASPAFIRGFAGEVAQRRAVFYTVLTYNGIQRWTPRHPADNQMVAAFHGHQMRDKGFGPSAGPTAPAHLADAFRLAGYSVAEGDSPWLLSSRDAALVEELARGYLSAVLETGRIDPATLAAWGKVARTGAEVGHTDTLAVPT
jgi:SAM-dependent methyltransferase